MQEEPIIIESKPRSLEELRGEIDRIDAELLNFLKPIWDLLVEREKIVREIGEIKEKEHIPPLDPKRWEEVVGLIRKEAEEKGLDPNMMQAILEEIHKRALIIETPREKNKK